MKIAGGANKEFAIKTKVKLVILKVVVIDRIDKVEKSYGVDKYKKN